MRPLLTVCADGLWQVRIPLPFPLRWVNAYLVKDPEGYTVIDPGIHTQDAEDAWQQVLRELDIHISTIKQIVLTHHHPDHFGLAGWFQAQCGAPVIMSPAGEEQTRLLWGQGQPANELILEQFRSHGMPPTVLDELEIHMRDFVSMVSPFPHTYRLIEPGETMTFGGTDWQTIHTPGHAFGHLCLYSPERREMFCGDQVLPQISPNISLIPGVDSDPMAAYLDSLASLETVQVDVAYPGHREPFRTFTERVKELQLHHQERLAQMQSILQVPMTVYELCRRLFGEQLSVHQLRFAMAETLAHVVYMERREIVRSTSAHSGAAVYTYSSLL